MTIGKNRPTVNLEEHFINEKNDAQHLVIKTPAHRSAEQFKIPNGHRKTICVVFKGGLIRIDQEIVPNIITGRSPPWAIRRVSSVKGTRWTSFGLGAIRISSQP